MKKTLSLILSFMMIITALTALPFNAFAKASTGDVYYGLCVYIDGNLENNKRPSISGSSDTFSLMKIHYSAGKVMGASVSCKDNLGNFAPTELDDSAAYYELTYTMNVFDSDDVFRTFDTNYLNIYVNGNKILNYTGNVKTYESGSQANGGLSVTVKYYNLQQNIDGNVKSLGFYSSSQDISITAPKVEGKHFTNWTGENGNHQTPVFGDEKLAETTIKIEPAVNIVTPNYEKHTFDDGVITKAATYDAYGIKTYTCTVCGETEEEPVAKLPKTDMSKATVSGIKAKVYTGKNLTQNITVKLGKTILKNGTDYTVSYKNNKNSGTASVTITGKGKYKGTINKTFVINPKAASLSKVTSPKSKQIKASWKKVTAQTTGYQIQIATDSKFKKNKKIVTVKNNKTTSVTIKNLKGKKKYYVRIRTYKKTGNKDYYSAWSKAKTVSTKK